MLLAPSAPQLLQSCRPRCSGPPPAAGGHDGFSHTSKPWWCPWEKLGDAPFSSCWAQGLPCRGLDTTCLLSTTTRTPSGHKAAPLPLTQKSFMLNGGRRPFQGRENAQLDHSGPSSLTLTKILFKAHTTEQASNISVCMFMPPQVPFCGVKTTLTFSVCLSHFLQSGCRPHTGPCGWGGFMGLSKWHQARSSPRDTRFWTCIEFDFRSHSRLDKELWNQLVTLKILPQMAKSKY